MADPNRIGVVIVNYNGGEYLSRCLDSLFRSDRELSVVVVDNGSSDGSFLGLDKLDTGGHQLQTVANGENFGFSRAVNIGVGTLQTEFIMLLNPDCVVHPHTLGRLADTFDDRPDTGIVGALVFNENGTEQRGCRRREPTLLRSAVTSLGLSGRFEGVDMTDEPLPADTLAVEAVSGSAMMIRRSLLLKLGGLDEDFFLHCEDLDLCHRVRREGFQVVFQPRVSLFHRQGASTGVALRKVERLKHDGMLTYYRKHYHGGIGIVLRVMEAMVWARYRTKLALSALGRTGPRGGGPMAPGIDFSTPILLLSGVGTDVGAAVMRRLHKTGRPCIAVTRGRPSSAGRGRTRLLSMEYFEKAPVDDLPVFGQWLHLAPIWTWEKFVGVFARQAPKRIVALSSTSAVAKADSNHPREKAVVEALLDGEKGMARYSIGNRATLTILRPTMIYGGPRNRNINLIRRLVRTLRVFPMPGAGAGKRQPIHASEVADACLGALERESVNGVYTIAGSETMSFRQMVEQVFRSQQIKPRFFVIPDRIARRIVSVAGRLPGLDMLSPQMLERLERDQAFSNERACRDIGFKPGPFRP